MWITLIVLLLIIQCAYLLRRRSIRYYGDDTWLHLLWADYIRQGIKFNNFHKFSLIDTKVDYPLGLAKILSLFRKKSCEKYQFLFSPLVDILNVVLVFLLAKYLTKDLRIASLASIIYAVNPAPIFSSFYLGPRPLGYLFVNLFLILVFFGNLNLLNLTLVIFFGALIMNIHKMSAQAMLFSLLGLSFLNKNFSYLPIFLFSFLVALFISKGYYWQVFIGHLRHIKNHIFFLYTKNTRKYPQSSISSSLIKVCFWGMWLLIFYLFLRPFETYQKILFFWYIILYSVFILTTFIKPLFVLGQGYRYLEYALVPFSILTAQLIIDRMAVWYILLPLFLVYLLLNLFRIAGLKRELNKDYTNIQDEDRFKVFELLKDCPGENIFCLPSGMSNSVAYFAKKRILWPIRDWDKAAWLFPYVALPFRFSIEEVIKKYRLDFILLHKKFCHQDDLGIVRYKHLHNIGNYLLFEL